MEKKNTTGKVRRRDQTALRVYCTPEEKKRISDRAVETGLSVSEYMRRVGLGYQPASVTDFKKVEEMIQVAADLGRLGGLLKWWLAGSAPVLQTREGKSIRIEESMLRRLLARIETTQKVVRDKCGEVLKVKSAARQNVRGAGQP